MEIFERFQNIINFITSTSDSLIESSNAMMDSLGMPPFSHKVADHHEDPDITKFRSITPVFDAIDRNMGYAKQLLKETKQLKLGKRRSSGERATVSSSSQPPPVLPPTFTKPNHSKPPVPIPHNPPPVVHNPPIIAHNPP
ncbi:hypothetical protein ADUPG1_003406, partial [Aduncisulcus paluster]